MLCLCFRKKTSFIRGSRISFQPADVMSRNNKSIELGKFSKLTISLRASLCLTCINDDIPNIENITMPKNNRTAILRSAGIETIKVIISRLIPRAALMTRRTLKIRNTRTTRSKVGETKNAKRFSKIKPIADNIITIKSNTLNGSRK